MAINNENTQAPSVKKYVDYANQQVDEQAILDKYNAATLAQFNIQREQNRQAENQFYNQMYNTQKTAMDTIRQSNAAAVSTGASRGVQAANELSSLLGLQSESIASATELAQANRQTAQEETAAVLENVLNAYQQAQQERANLLSSAIEAESVEVQREANQAQSASAAAELDRANADALQKASETGFDNYMAEVATQNKNYKDAYSLEGANSLNLALGSLTATGEGQANTGEYFTTNDFVASGTNTAAIQKATQLQQHYQVISDTYGLDLANDKDFQELQNTLLDVVNKKSRWTDTGWGKFIDVLTLGLASDVERKATGADKRYSTEGMIATDAFGRAITNEYNDTRNELTKAAQMTYTLLNNYIKTKYNNKKNNTAQ